MFARLLQVLNVIIFFTIELEAMFNSAYADCAVSIKDDLVGNTQPLLIQTTFGKPRIVVPTVSDKIHLKQNDKIEIFCPGNFILLNDSSLGVDLAKVVCDKGKFILNRSTIRFSWLSCWKSVKDVARPTQRRCLRDYQEFEIGYQYKNDFLTFITGCFDDNKKITLYTISTISRTIDRGTYTYPRKSSWAVGPFYEGISVDTVYKRKEQKIAVNRQLNLNADSTKYITDNDQNYYLVRGHLVPKADYMYSAQQNSTFYFLNAIPQWSLLNNGNWKILEYDLRRFAYTQKIDLKIYTGTSGIFSLPDNFTKRPIELFLDKQKRIPIPKFIWKVAYHEASARGVVFVGVNNPFLENDLSKFTICKNICNKLNYIHITSTSYGEKGYVYCCEVSDLINIVPTIPIRNITKLLTSNNIYII